MRHKLKIILLILISNILFSQSIPEPKSIATTPPSIKELENSSVDNELKDALEPFFKVKKYGIGIIRYYPTEHYSSTGASFSIFNPSKKTIKYIWFTVSGENAVGDLVKTSKGYYKTLKGIGPIEPNNIAQWSFDYVWLTDTVEYLNISTIKIQYMDGTFRTIKYNDNLYIGEAAYERSLLALNNKNKEEYEIKNEKKKFADVSEDDERVFSVVEQSAEFPGGYLALRRLFKEKLNTSEFVTDISGAKTEISLTIEKDGSISDVKAEGLSIEFNNEAIKTMKSIRTKWTPALINGIKVRSIYKTKFNMR